MAKPLTTKGIEALKLKPRTVRKRDGREVKETPARWEVPDGRGLYVLVGPNGASSWVFRYRRPVTNQPAKMVLGTVYLGDEPPKDPKLGGPLTLAQARRFAEQARSDLELGRDPGREKKDAEAERRAAMKDTFGHVLDRYYTEKVPRKKRKRTAAKSRKLIEANCADWLDLPIRSITRRDVRTLLSKAATRGRGTIANAIQAVLSPVFNWAVEQEILDANPVQQVEKLVESSERERCPDDVELVELWRAAGTLGDPWADLARTLILTGQRLGAVEAMRWGHLRDLDGAAPEWRVPAGDMKMNAEFIVPLSAPVVALIKQRAAAWRARIDATEDAARRKLLEAVPFVFWCGRVSRKGTIAKLSGRSRFRDAWRAAVDQAREKEGREPMPHWQPHDLRRSMSTGLAELGVPLHVIELVLDHRPRSIRGVAKRYQKYEFLAERRSAMNVWAAHVEALVSGQGGAANVVPLRG